MKKSDFLKFEAHKYFIFLIDYFDHFVCEDCQSTCSESCEVNIFLHTLKDMDFRYTIAHLNEENYPISYRGDCYE